jgi:hypothetical protein
MLGEPSDVDGQCNARLFTGDNYGDGSATIRCQRAPDHGGLHQEKFKREGGLVTITWVADERKKCDHGCGQWRHDHRDEDVACPQNADDHEYSDCAYCHPNKKGQTCTVCSKTCYWEAGHQASCQKEIDRPPLSKGLDFMSRVQGGSSRAHGRRAYRQNRRA